jgi:hypothetical protein
VKIRARWHDLREGLHYGYPLCCVLRFALSRWAAQAARRSRLDDERPYVVCGIFHRSGGRDPRWGSPGWDRRRYGSQS